MPDLRIGIPFCPGIIYGFGLAALLVSDIVMAESRSYWEDKVYHMRYQPELDNLQMERYFRTRRLVKFQAKCFFYGGPCDIVGQWAKPRIKTGLLGRCVKCTPTQEAWLHNALDLVHANFPDLFRALIARYIEYYGVKLPEADRRLVANLFET